MKTKSLFGLVTSLLMTFSLSAQWVPQTLPTTIGVPHLDYPGVRKNAIGKKDLWLFSRNYTDDSTRLGAVESVRTLDGGNTYQVNTLPFQNIGTSYSPTLLDEKTAFLATTNRQTGQNSIYRSVDSGSTWQSLPYHPATFLNAVIFYDLQNGLIICDPDSLGAFIAYTIDGGNTFMRVSPTSLPQTQPKETFWGGSHQIIGDVIFQPSVDNEAHKYRVWRSLDRGQTWTSGEWMQEGSPFGPNLIFTDANHGFWAQGILTPVERTFYTTDGGHTWQASGQAPSGFSGGPLSYVPNTHQIICIFEDTMRHVLFSSVTNDFGKTWNTRKDLAPYRRDSIYVPFGLPAFGWSNLDIVDNHTAWAKISRTELYRYDSETPLVPEKPDLDLQLKADKDDLPLYGAVKYTLTVTNRGIAPATGVQINWLPPYKRMNEDIAPYAYQAAYADKGNYDSWNGVWTLDKIEAGATATATFHLFVLDNAQPVVQTAQVVTCNESDIDSSPNNRGAETQEDDEARFVAKASKATLRKLLAPSKVPFGVSPNPAKDKILVSINTDASWSIRVLNNIGQTVFTQNGQNNQQLEVDTHFFENGLYLVDYQSEGKRNVEKIVVQH